MTILFKGQASEMSARSPVYQLLEREPKLADKAMIQLQTLIVNRTFTPGDRLPSEQELAKQLGVSRTVIREALRGLSIKGLVEVRGGAGAFVRSPTTDLFSELLGMCVLHIGAEDVTGCHILEMRRTLEIEMAGLAARRRETKDLSELDRLVGLMGQPELTREEWARVDYQFHDVLAIASKNPLFPIVLRSISDVLMQSRLLGARWPETRSNALYHHRRILEALKAGSVRRARAAMEGHLREAEDTMRRVLAKDAAEPQAELGKQWFAGSS